jgi:hypothetical protein
VDEAGLFPAPVFAAGASGAAGFDGAEYVAGLGFAVIGDAPRRVPAGAAVGSSFSGEA